MDQQELSAERLASLTQEMKIFRTLLLQKTDPERRASFDALMENVPGLKPKKSRVEANRAKYVLNQKAILEVFDNALKELEKGNIEKMATFYQVFSEIQERTMAKVDYSMTLATKEDDDESPESSLRNDLQRSLERKPDVVSKEVESFMEQHPDLFADDGEDARHVLAVDLDLGSVPEGLPQDAPNLLKLLANILKSHGISIDVSITTPEAN